MNASNNFTVVGFICKDAEVRNFEKSSIARFGVSIKTTEKKGGVEITSSSIQSFETWIKNDDQALLDLLKKGQASKGGRFLQERDLSEGWQGPSCDQAYRHQPLRGREAKEGGGSLASFPKSAMFIFPRLSFR